MNRIVLKKVREDTLEDDASRLSDMPGSHEFWNFFAFDLNGDLGISMIFLSANMWDVNMRNAVYTWRKDQEKSPPPGSADYFLLQLNVTKGAEKIFSSVKNPPGTKVEFSPAEPRGRIGQSTFYGSMVKETKTYKVHIDAADTMNTLRLKADVEFHAASPGFAVDGAGLFGEIPGGQIHDWQWPIGYPQTSGTVLVTDRSGGTLLSEAFSKGGGYVDHMWGEGLLSDVLDSWYFGRIDLGSKGALVYVWLTPKLRKGKPYGRVFRIPWGGLAASHDIISFTGAELRTGSFGLEYYSDLSFTLAGGGAVQSIFGNPAVEDWPFQVAGPAVISVDIPGDVSVTGQPGLGEYLQQEGIDSEAYQLMFSALHDMPWNP